MRSDASCVPAASRSASFAREAMRSCWRRSSSREDVYSDAEISEAVGTTDVKKPELALAHQIIESLDATFDPATLTSSYRRDLRALLEAKLQGEELRPAAEAEPERAPAVDLLEALKASVAAAKVGRNAAPKQPAKPKKAPAKSRA